MTFTRYLCTAFLALSLTACLKVTGEAKDQFDVEDEEDSLGFGATFTPLKNRSKDATETQNTVGRDSIAEEDTIETTNEQATTRLLDIPNVGETPSSESKETSTQNPSTIDPQEFADFQLWKKERNSNSSEYQEFLEYQEYKKWLEFQKGKEQ